MNIMIRLGLFINIISSISFVQKSKTDSNMMTSSLFKRLYTDIYVHEFNTLSINHYEVNVYSNVYQEKSCLILLED